jgi:hypothetical protein
MSASDAYAQSGKAALVEGLDDFSTVAIIGLIAPRLPRLGLAGAAQKSKPPSIGAGRP